MAQSLLDKNLAALDRRFPELAARLRNLAPSGRYRALPRPDGGFDLAYSNGSGEVRLPGGEEAAREALRRHQARTLPNPINVLFLGLDLGHGLAAFLQAPPRETLNLYLVERDLELFYYLLQATDLAPAMNIPGLHLLIGVPEDELFLACHALLSANERFQTILATEVLGDSQSYRADIPYYKAAMRGLRDAASDLLAFAGNSSHDSFVGVRNMLLNLDVIAREPGLERLFGAFSGKPAVIVAAGPSLDKNIDLLNELQNRAVILSVDASLRQLLKRGVRPHFVTVLERVDFSPHFFQGFTPEECADTVQVAVPVVVPEVYEVYPGPKALLYRPYSHFKWLEREKGTLLTGASCANMAFKIAVALGCDPILLVGQDLAYGEDGSTHSEVVPWGKLQQGIQAHQVDAFPVKGNLRDQVLTNRNWNMFRLAYVKDVAAFGGRVVNATEGGAYIDGTEVTTLRRAIDRYAPTPFPTPPAETIRRALSPAPEHEVRAYLDRMEKVKIPETLRAIDGFRRECRALLERYERLGRDGRAELSPEETGKEVAKAFALFDRMIKDELLYESIFHVLQPTTISAMVEYFGIPNHHPDRRQAGRMRLRLMERLLSELARMIDLLRDLYEKPHESLCAERFEKNLALLSARYPKLAKQMRELAPDDGVRRNWRQGQGWFLEGPGAGQPVFADDPATYGAMDLFLGLDLHPEFLKALQRESRRSRAVALVERNPQIFRHLLHVFDLAALGKSRIPFYWIGESASPTVDAETPATSHLLSSIDDLHAVRSGREQAAYDRALETLRREFRLRRDMHREPRAYVERLGRLLRNAPALLRFAPFGAVADAARGRPAAVVLPDADPALVKRLAEKRRGDLVWLTYAEGADHLRRLGVTPHVHVPRHAPGADPQRVEGAVEALGLDLAPQAYGRDPSEAVLSQACPGELSWLLQAPLAEEEALAPAEPLALRLASALGCSPIVCLGVPAPRQGDDPEHEWNSLQFARAAKLLGAHTPSLPEEVDGLFAEATRAGDATPFFVPPPSEARAAQALERFRRDALPTMIRELDEALAILRELAQDPAPDTHPDRCPFYRKLVYKKNWFANILAWNLWFLYSFRWAELGAGREGEALPPYRDMLARAQTLFGEALDLLRGSEGGDA